MTLTKQLNKTNMVQTVFVVAFVAAGLAVVPAFVQDADAERKKPKKNKSDFTIDEPVIKLVKDKPKKSKDKG